MDKLIRMLLVTGLILFVSSSASADEFAVRKVIMERALELVIGGNTEVFDKWSTELLTTNALTPAGASEYALVYEAIGNLDRVAVQNPLWNQVEAVSQEFLNREPDNSSAILLRAAILQAHAWAYRGAGYAPDVVTASWDPFFTLAKESRSVLDSKKMTRLSSPEWYALRVTAAKALNEGLENTGQIADEILEAAPDYGPAVGSVFSFYLPKWFGMTELAQDWVSNVVKKTKDKQGSQRYAHMYFGLIEYLSPDLIRNELSNAGVSWPKLKTSMKEVSNAFPDPYNWNVERVMTCILGSKDDKKAVLVAHKKEDITQVAVVDTPAWQEQCETDALGGVSAKSAT